MACDIVGRCVRRCATRTARAAGRAATARTVLRATPIPSVSPSRPTSNRKEHRPRRGSVVVAGHRQLLRRGLLGFLPLTLWGTSLGMSLAIGFWHYGAGLVIFGSLLEWLSSPARCGLPRRSMTTTTGCGPDRAGCRSGMGGVPGRASEPGGLLPSSGRRVADPGHLLRADVFSYRRDGERSGRRGRRGGRSARPAPSPRELGPDS